MKRLKVAINGFGRIGRIVLRAALAKKTNFDIVAINHPRGVANAAYMFTHDTAYGLFPGKVKVDEKSSTLTINGKKIVVVAERDITKLPWKKLGVDVVIEATGVFKEKEDALGHIKRGAKNVLVTAPSKTADFNVILGVNDSGLDARKQQVISNCSCTSNCLGPIVYVLEKEFGIVRAFFNTIHAYTNDQRLHDDYHKKLRRSRAAAQNIVPTNSGASVSVVQAIPELEGKLAGLAIRVPVIVGSVTDITAELSSDFEISDIHKAMQKYARGKMKGILEYSEDEIVSSDIIGNTYSSIYDSLTTMKDGNMVKILAWYDNEVGYSNRLVDVVNLMAKQY